MRKVFYLTLCMVLMLVNIDIVDAEMCDSEDMARLKGLAAGVSYNSEYIGKSMEADNYQQYRVNFIGLTNEIYISDSHYTFTVNNDSQFIKLNSGNNVLEIYSRNCYHLRLKSIEVNLPKYNIYADYDVCKEEDNKDLDVCSPSYTGDISVQDFYDIIDNNYTKLHKDDETIVDKIKNTIFDNVYIVGMGGLVLSIIIVILIIVRTRKNRLD